VACRQLRVSFVLEEVMHHWIRPSGLFRSELTSETMNPVRLSGRTPWRGWYIYHTCQLNRFDKAFIPCLKKYSTKVKPFNSQFTRTGLKDSRPLNPVGCDTHIYRSRFDMTFAETGAQYRLCSVRKTLHLVTFLLLQYRGQW